MRRATLIGLLLTGLAYADDASAANDLCGQTLTTNTTLTDDQSCTDDGLIVGADGITIDLGGFTLSGSGDLGTVGIALGNHGGITIKNGTIRAFDRGVRDGSFHNKLSHVVLRDNKQEGAILDNGIVDKCSFINNASAGLILPSTSGGKVTSSTFVGNGFEGLFLQHAEKVTVANVLAARNHGAGIRVQFGSKITITSATSAHNALAGVELDTGTATLRHSTIVGNTLDGVHLDDAGVDTQESLGIRAVIDGNVIAGNGGDGIRLTNASNGNAITNNRLTGNGSDGVRIDAASVDTLVKGNKAIGNLSAGFEVVDTTTTLANNVGDANSAGILATSGAIDGGGNKARANGGTQCSDAIACPPAFTPKAGPTTPTCAMHVSTSIKLGADPPPCNGTSGIIVEADGITIDLNGHRYHGDRTNGTIGIDVEFNKNVTIKNGIIQGFGVGIFAESPSDGLKIVNVEVRDSSEGGMSILGPHTTIDKTVVVKNTGNGVAFGDLASAAKISSTFFVGNSGDGVIANSAGITLRNVTAAGNLGAGVHLASGDGTLKGGVATANGDAGIVIDGSFGAAVPSSIKKTFVAGNENQGIVLTSNSIAMTFDSNFSGGNGEAGIQLLDTPQDTVLKKNVLIGNRFEGIRIDSFPLTTFVVQNVLVGNAVGVQSFPVSPTTFTKNTAVGNEFQGIESFGTIDGGGNKAHDNAGEPQCSQGLVCD